MTAPRITVRKLSAYVPISIELALDCGVITEAQALATGWRPTPRVTPSWRTRLRWHWHSFRERLGRRVGGWIAGLDLSEDNGE